MRNPEKTRSAILRQSGELFNVQGYKATSLSDITEATGLTKGAIYKHFGSKEELEWAACNESFGRLSRSLREAVEGKPTAPARLLAVTEFFRTYVTDPVIRGGCPLMNTAIEADDTDPRLRQGAARFLDALQHSLERMVKAGVERGEIAADVREKPFASVVIATLEGAVMMSRLRGDGRDMEAAIEHLREWISSITVKEGS
jgi:AcrR family transcriptional regulator